MDKAKQLLSDGEEYFTWDDWEAPISEAKALGITEDDINYFFRKSRKRAKN